jgi:hypothetical protein
MKLVIHKVLDRIGLMQDFIMLHVYTCIYKKHLY